MFNTKPKKEDQLLVVNASSLLTGTPDPSAGRLTLQTSDRGDVHVLWNYLKTFLVTPVALAGCVLPPSVNSPKDIKPLVDLLKMHSNKKVLVLVDETDRHGIDFATTAHFFSSQLQHHPELRNKQILFAPATQSIRTDNNADTTFTFGAAYQHLMASEPTSGVFIGSRATVSGSGGMYFRDQKIVVDVAGLDAETLSKRPTIHLIQLGGTVGGFNGALSDPPPLKISMDNQIVGHFFGKLGDKFKVETATPFFDDSRNLRPEHIQELRKQIKEITDAGNPVVVSVGSFMAGAVARAIGPQKAPVVLIGGHGVLGRALTDGGFNAGTAVEYIYEQMRKKSDTYETVVAMGGDIISADQAIKIGDRNAVISSAVAGKIKGPVIVSNPHDKRPKAGPQKKSGNRHIPK